MGKIRYTPPGKIRKARIYLSLYFLDSEIIKYQNRMPTIVEIKEEINAGRIFID